VSDTASAIFDMAESGQADQLRDELRSRCDQSLYYFAKAVLNYKDMTDHLHFDMCTAAQGGPIKQGFLVPRAHLKSTILTKAKVLWKVCRDPEERRLIVGESDTVAAKNLKDIKWHILNNQILKWLYPEIIPPDFNATKWTDTEILLPRRGSYDESTITTCGVGAKMTGFHFTGIDYDDIFGEIAARSDAEKERVVEWVQYAPGLLVDPETSEESWQGTRWKHGLGDIYGWIMENMPYVAWYRRSAIENGVPIWPERFSLARLEEIRLREGDYKFACQYLNDPTPPEGSDFAPSWIRYYSVADDRVTIVPEDGTPSVHVSQLYRNCFLDPSSGGRSAGCENAIIGLGQAADRRKFVLTEWGSNCDYGAAIEKLHLLHDQFIFHDVYFEAVGAQKEIGNQIRARRVRIGCDACGKQHRVITPREWIPPGGRNKEDRIRMFLQEEFSSGRMYLRRSQEQLRNQILMFPHATMVDRLDALASCVKTSRVPLTDEYIKDEKEKMARMEAKRVSRTHTQFDYGGYV